MSFINRLIALSILSLSVLLLSPVHAASACKGLSKSSCGSKSSCTWVDGYTRKDGKQVSAYCRTVSKKKSDSKQSDKSKSSSSDKKSSKDSKADSKSDKKSSKDSNKTTEKKQPKKEPKKEAKKETNKSS